jgi:AcrR family transcriptional regulator
MPAKSSAQAPLSVTVPTEVPAAVVDRLSPVVMQIYSAGDFHRVDMRTIAREAGMSFRTIYGYFGDKEALLFWFINHWLGGLYPAALAPLREEGTLKAKLFEVLRLHLEFYEQNPLVGRIIFMTVPLERWMRDSSYGQPELMSTVMKAIAEGQKSGELRRDIDARIILDVWSAIFNRAFLMWEYRGRCYPLSKQAVPMYSVLWDGIAARR